MPLWTIGVDLLFFVDVERGPISKSKWAINQSVQRGSPMATTSIEWMVWSWWERIVWWDEEFQEYHRKSNGNGIFSGTLCLLPWLNIWSTTSHVVVCLDDFGKIGTSPSKRGRDGRKKRWLSNSSHNRHDTDTEPLSKTMTRIPHYIHITWHSLSHSHCQYPIAFRWRCLLRSETVILYPALPFRWWFTFHSNLLSNFLRNFLSKWSGS